MDILSSNILFGSRASGLSKDTLGSARGKLRRTTMLTVAGSLSLLSMAQTAAAQDSGATEQDRDEIIVTATRRETTLQETPLSISAIGEEQIEKRNLRAMDDYLQSVPGVSYQDRGAGSNTVTIRGISTGSQLSANTPTGNYFGEVSITGLGPQLNGNQAGNGDVRMVDVERIEVLRGPQGTLFGSGALGGAVRVIPNAPDLNDFSGRITADVSNTARRGSWNYGVDGFVNIPLIEDRLALRVVGFKFFDDGFVDNVAASRPTAAITAAKALGVAVRDRKGVGSNDVTGGRATLLWEPIDGLKLTAMHLYQQQKNDGLAGVDTLVDPNDYLQARPRTGPTGNADEFVSTKMNLSNLVVEYDWSWGNLLNSTAYIDSKARHNISVNFFASVFLGVYAGHRNHKRVFINETRFTSKWDFPVQVIGGLYYSRFKHLIEAGLVYNGTVPAPAGTIQTNGPLRDAWTTQKAAFGELAFTPWEPFTLTVGGRYFKFENAFPLYLSAQVPPTPHPDQGRTESIDGFNWKANASWKVTPDLFLYAQWAQGFREPQIQNALDDAVFDPDGNGLYNFADGSQRRPIEGLLDPDTVDTYEAGVKFSTPSGDLSGALSAYYTDWKGIPVSLLTVPTGAAFFFNAGSATVKGVEFELNGRIPEADLHAQFSASWSEAKLGNDAESRSLAGGQRDADLPGSPDFNVYTSLEKRFTLGGENPAFVRGDMTYVSAYTSTLNGMGRAGDYFLFGASAGVTLDNIRLMIYAKNLTNRKDFTWIDNTLAAGRAYRLRPRTIGINASFEF